jgi:bis(5'-nucleosyl)-tetraphosphatase (symmetrical)
MAHYAIGDVQGCCDELLKLLSKIAFNFGTDTLWLRVIWSTVAPNL